MEEMKIVQIRGEDKVLRETAEAKAASVSTMAASVEEMIGAVGSLKAAEQAIRARAAVTRCQAIMRSKISRREAARAARLRGARCQQLSASLPCSCMLVYGAVYGARWPPCIRPNRLSNQRGN